MGASPPIVSVVVVVYAGGWKWLSTALTALRRHTTEPWELILVDNGPRQRFGPIRRMQLRGASVIRNPENFGFGVACNQGAAVAQAPVLCFLNPDAFVRPGWLSPLMRALELDQDTGAVVPQNLNPDGSLHEAGAFVDSRGHPCLFGAGDDPGAPEHRFRREVDYGSASCLCIQRETFEKLGGFDPVYELGYFEDADLCFRLRERGLKTMYEPRSQVVHVRTTSIPLEEAIRVSEKNRSIFFERWQRRLVDRPTCSQIADDPRHAIAARDLHASQRLLVLESPTAARTLIGSHPHARVTLLSNNPLEAADREALLATGVEVVEQSDWHGWLRARPHDWTRIAGDASAASRLRTLVETAT